MNEIESILKIDFEQDVPSERKMAVAYLAKEGGKLVGGYLLRYLWSSLQGGCNDEYEVTQGMTGGGKGIPGHTYLRLKCPRNLVVNEKNLSGYPTLIIILFGPGSRIRDMFNARYSGQSKINVREFIDWFNPIMERKINMEGANIELQVKPSTFERAEVTVHGPPIQICRYTYTKTQWSVFIYKE